MTKLCEIIALTTARKPEATRRLTDLHQQTQKAGLFSGLHKTYQPRDAADMETLPEERTEIQLRVADVVRDMEKVMTNLYDLVVTQDVGNQQAFSDLVVNGKVLVAKVPVTTLLWLEKQLDDLKKFYSTLPVLDPAKSWRRDEGNRCYRTETVKTRTKRTKLPIVLYAATEHHPAQTQLIEEDKIVGDYTTVEFSGAITPHQRQTLLERLSLLKDAVVLARERANQTTVDQEKVGAKLFQYIHEGV